MLKLLLSILPALCSYLKQRFDKPTGITFIDSTSLKACHNMRNLRHQVFAGEVRRGKVTMGWFYGFKLRLIMNDEGGLLAVKGPLGTLMIESLCHIWSRILQVAYTLIKTIYLQS